MVQNTGSEYYSLINGGDQLYIERAFLGSVLSGATIPEDMSDLMFTGGPNRTIFTAAKELLRICANVNILELVHYLKGCGRFDEAGGSAYVAELTSLVPGPSNIGYYAQVMRDSFSRRSLDSLLATAREELSKGKPAAEIVNSLPQAFLTINTGQAVSEQIMVSIDANDLMNKEFPDTGWIVENLIAQGLTVLTGSAKIGKSWLGLQLAVAVDCGGCFLGTLPAQKSGVLYLALEDTEKRLKERMEKLDVKKTGNLCFVTKWKGRPSQIRNILRQNPVYKLVIIDTLQKFTRISDINDYTETVNTLSILKGIADELGIAIIVIHHNRKGFENGSGDWMEGGLGSTGINATADCTITLTRKRKAGEGFLRAAGRDIEEVHWAMRWDKTHGIAQREPPRGRRALYLLRLVSR